MKKYVIRYGILGGILSIGSGLLNWLLIAKNFGSGISQIIGYFTAILSLMCVPLGIKYFRDKLNNGIVSFSQGFKIGLGISFITSFMVFCYTFLFFAISGDDYNAWRTNGLSESEMRELQVRMEQMPEFALTPWFQGFVVSLSVFLVGLIINLISSLILKRSAIGINQN